MINAGDPVSIPGPGRYPGEENGSPLQYSCLKNSMVREARQVPVHGDAESDTTEQLTLVCICVCVSVSVCVCVYKEIEKTLLETQMCCSEIKDWGEIWNYPKIST